MSPLLQRDLHGRLRLSTFKPFGKRNRLIFAALRAEAEVEAQAEATKDSQHTTDAGSSSWPAECKP